MVLHNVAPRSYTYPPGVECGPVSLLHGVDSPLESHHVLWSIREKIYRDGRERESLVYLGKTSVSGPVSGVVPPVIAS